MKAIEIEGLVKSYHSAEAPVLNDLSLTINSGERFGLFGSNGAGKTTLISIISGILKFDSGKVNVLGEDIAKNWGTLKSRIGIVPQEYAFYTQLSAIENMTFFGKMYKIDSEPLKRRIEELVEDFGMNDYAHKRALDYSGGMKRKLNLALGVLHQPDLLILDEPTVGVDVKSKTHINHYLKELNEKKQTTFLYTSHMMDEAQQLCSHIGILKDGQISESMDTASFLKKHKESNMENVMMSILD